MILRLMLVGFVASMGFEMQGTSATPCCPTPAQLWEAGEATQPEGPVAARVPVRDPDLAFDVASGEMADAFAADLIASRAAEPDSGPEGETTVGPILAGIPEAEESAGRDLAAMDGVAVAVGEPTEASAEVDASASRSARLSSAVEMTRQAVRAWADVMADVPADDCAR